MKIKMVLMLLISMLLIAVNGYKETAKDVTIQLNPSNFD
jgi:hypothetical protein